MCDLRAHTPLLEKLGKYTKGGGCFYIKRLSDIDLPTLKKLLVIGFTTPLPGETTKPFSKPAAKKVAKKVAKPAAKKVAKKVAKKAASKGR